MKMQIQINPHLSHLVITRDREAANMFKSALRQALEFLDHPGTAATAQAVAADCHKEMLEGVSALDKLAMLPAEMIFIAHEELERSYKLLSVAAIWAFRNSSCTDRDVCFRALAMVTEGLPCPMEPRKSLPPPDELDFEDALFDEKDSYAFLSSQGAQDGAYLPLAPAMRLCLWLSTKQTDLPVVEELVRELSEMTFGLRSTLGVLAKIDAQRELERPDRE